MAKGSLCCNHPGDDGDDDAADYDDDGDDDFGDYSDDDGGGGDTIPGPCGMVQSKIEDHRLALPGY